LGRRKISSIVKKKGHRSWLAKYWIQRSPQLDQLKLLNFQSINPGKSPQLDHTRPIERAFFARKTKLNFL